MAGRGALQPLKWEFANRNEGAQLNTEAAFLACTYDYEDVGIGAFASFP